MIHPDEPDVKAQWARDIGDVHLIYDYAAKNAETGAPEKWRYEMWFSHEDRCTYAIHGGPLAGRNNFQAADYQCIRPGELWQCNWLEETGTKKITTLLNFSRGHWDNPSAAHGDKRVPADFARWRALAHVGSPTDRTILNEQADIVDVFRGPGELEPIDPAWPTL